MDKNFFKDMTYGMFVLSTKYKGRDVGCFVNTVAQITSESGIFAISVNKNNYTNEAIKASKKFAVAILSTETAPEVIGKFGFYSSKEVDKFKDFKTTTYDDIKIVDEKICGYMICELLEVISVDTHDIFLGKLVDCKKINDLQPMTYSFYHNHIKGKAPKTAPTYINEEETKVASGKKYQCTICGYIYDEAKEGVAFEDLPDDWHCPLCGVGKELFKPVE